MGAADARRGGSRGAGRTWTKRRSGKTHRRRAPSSGSFMGNSSRNPAFFYFVLLHSFLVSSRRFSGAGGSVAVHDWLSRQFTFGYHSTVRWFLDRRFRGMDFDHQLRRVWITQSRLCSLDESGGSARTSLYTRCENDYLVAQLRLLPNVPIVAFGGKAQSVLRRLQVDVPVFEVPHPSARGTEEPKRGEWERAIAKLQRWCRHHPAAQLNNLLGHAPHDPKDPIHSVNGPRPGRGPDQGHRSPRLKVIASNGRMLTGSSFFAVAIGTHSPSRSSNASRVRSAGSTSHRWRTPAWA